MAISDAPETHKSSIAAATRASVGVVSAAALIWVALGAKEIMPAPWRVLGSPTSEIIVGVLAGVALTIATQAWLAVWASRREFKAEDMAFAEERTRNDADAGEIIKRLKANASSANDHAPSAP